MDARIACSAGFRVQFEKLIDNDRKRNARIVRERKITVNRE